MPARLDHGVVRRNRGLDGVPVRVPGVLLFTGIQDAVAALLAVVGLAAPDVGGMHVGEDNIASGDLVPSVELAGGGSAPFRSDDVLEPLAHHKLRGLDVEPEKDVAKGAGVLMAQQVLEKFLIIVLQHGLLLPKGDPRGVDNGELVPEPLKIANESLVQHRIFSCHFVCLHDCIYIVL